MYTFLMLRGFSMMYRTSLLLGVGLMVAISSSMEAAGAIATAVTRAAEATWMTLQTNPTPVNIALTAISAGAGVMALAKNHLVGNKCGHRYTSDATDLRNVCGFASIVAAGVTPFLSTAFPSVSLGCVA